MLPVYILYGAPTSGKGTICKQFPSENVISMGQLLRNNHLVQGAEMVSSDTVNALLKKELILKQSQSYVVLDGYPRTSEQIKYIKSIPFIELRRFIHLSCSDCEVFRRTKLREVCLCGASYMPVLKPAKVDGICDLCGGQLFKREDDDIEKVTRRLEIYHAQTPKILSAFKDIRLDIDMNDNDCFKQACRVLSTSDKNFEFLLQKEKLHG